MTRTCSSMLSSANKHLATKGNCVVCLYDDVLQASAVADDRFGNLLRLKSSMPSSRGGVLPRRGCSLQLELEISWPLTAFLPPVSQLAQPFALVSSLPRCSSLIEARHV